MKDIRDSQSRKRVLAIIGAGEGSLPIIKKAKEMGIETVAFGRSDSIAKDIVNVFVEDPSLKIGGELEGKAASAKWITKPGSSLKIEQLSVYQNVLFMSSKSSVAYADSDGVIHARSKGSAKLKAKVNGKTISIIVSVK